MSVMTVPAEIRITPSTCAIEGASSGTPFTSTTTRGAYVPSRSRMMRSVPPARIRASGPCSARMVMAADNVVGRRYSNRRTRPSDDLVDLVEQDLRIGRSDEEIGSIGELLDEGGTRAPELRGVHD